MRLSRTAAVAMITAFASLGCGSGIPTVEGTEGPPPPDAYLAAQGGDLAAVMSHLEDGMKVNKPDGEGRTLLHYAAAGGQQAIVYKLIEDYQADPNVRDAQGQTPLAYARQSGNPSVYDMIQRSGGTE